MKEPIAILDSQIDQHPASLAWRQVDGGKFIPQVIEVLKQNRKTSIYRLIVPEPDGGTIIAKRCLNETGRLEQAIYEKILPFLPVSALHYYGYLEETDSEVWLFLEDAGEHRFSVADESHRILAAQWLGALHASAVQSEAARKLPERGPAHYLELLRMGRRYIVENLTNPILMPVDVELLQKILRQMDALESNWTKLLEVCQVAPQTLVHGDFQPKNIHVKQYPAGKQLCVMDWEKTGWGVPMVDVAQSSGSSNEAQIDLPVYLSIIQEIWRDLDMPTLKYYVHVGVILRRLAAIYWSSLELPYPWVETPIRRMDIYHKDLAGAMIGVFGKELANGRRA